MALACLTAQACSALSGGLHGQVAPPTPDSTPGPDSDELLGPDGLPQDDGGGAPETNGPVAQQGQKAPEPQDAASADEADEADGPPPLGATVWLDRAFALWHSNHYAAAIDALHEALATGSLNDAGSALAYWHIYLSEQALGHGPAGLKALSDFVAVAQDIGHRAQAPGGEALQDFSRSFDLTGRLARARATLNLAWAEQTHRAGHSPKQPVLVFDDAELSHFLELAPPCAQTSDARVVALQRERDHLGRATARATIRCRSMKAERHYYFAFIGPQDLAQAEPLQAADQ